MVKYILRKARIGGRILLPAMAEETGITLL